MTFRERVRVPVLWWIVTFGIAATLAVAVFAYVELWLGILFTLLMIAIVVVGLLGYELRISVADGELRVGRNRIGAEYIGEVQALRGADADRALGPGADHRSYLITRPFARDVVRVEVVDDADPHTAWLISTRNPDALADAIRTMQGA